MRCSLVTLEVIHWLEHVLYLYVYVRTSAHAHMHLSYQMHIIMVSYMRMHICILATSK